MKGGETHVELKFNSTENKINYSSNSNFLTRNTDWFSKIGKTYHCSNETSNHDFEFITITVLFVHKYQIECYYADT